MASIFLSCLGQLVDTLRELQFWIEQVRLVRIEARETAVAAAALWATRSGERLALVLDINLGN